MDTVLNALGSVHPLMNEREVAQLLAIQVPTLRRWRWAGQGPHFIKLGSAVRYTLEDVETFIEKGRRTSTFKGSNSGV